jgi:hypothetical protein
VTPNEDNFEEIVAKLRDIFLENNNCCVHLPLVQGAAGQNFTRLKV